MNLNFRVQRRFPDMCIKFSASACRLLVPALLLLTLSCGHGVSAAAPSNYGCMSDEIMKTSGPLPSVVISEPHTTTAGFAFALSNQWESLRITVSAEDLHDPSKYCAKGTVSFKGGPKRNDMKGKEVDCSYSDVLTPEAATILTTEILPRAIKLHTDRLLVQRSRGPWKMPSFASDSVCANFKVPELHRTTGLTDTDMMLYVAAAPLRAVGKEKSVAWAVPCAQLNERPVAGAMNFAADKIVLSRHIVRITAHELAHALGFTASFMQAKNMVEKMEVRPKTSVSVVKSTETKTKVQKHYSCAAAKGMELQMKEDGQPESHWSRRNAKDELMAPLVSSDDAFLGLYTTLTLAAFADLGYYKAKFELAEPMSWGHDAKCGFLDDQCVKSGVSQFPAMFCAAVNYNQQVCSSDRIGVGRCSLLTRVSSIPEQFRYFANEKHGGDPDLFTDYCPIISRPGGLFCTNTNTGFSSTIIGSVRGESSWCLDGASLVAKDGEKNESVDGVCAEVRCNDKTVSVKYSGSDAFHLCPEGQTIPAQSSAFASGSIKCPKYSEVCTVASDGSSLFGAPVVRERRSTQEPDRKEVGATKKFKEQSNVAAGHEEHKGHSDGAASPNSALFGPFLLAVAVVVFATASQTY